MEIQSAFSSGVQGFQKATEDASKAASDIAQQTASSGQQEFEAQEAQATQPQTATTPVAQEPTGITESVVNLKVAEVQAKASAEVVQSADENLGTLIDVRV
jgi:septation ring formation regulator EzrA